MFNSTYNAIGKEGEDEIYTTLVVGICDLVAPSVFLAHVWIEKRNWVFATNSDFLIPITLQPVFLDLWYFKLLILLDQIV